MFGGVVVALLLIFLPEVLPEVPSIIRGLLLYFLPQIGPTPNHTSGNGIGALWRFSLLSFQLFQIVFLEFPFIFRWFRTFLPQILFQNPMRYAARHGTLRSILESVLVAPGCFRDPLSVCVVLVVSRFRCLGEMTPCRRKKGMRLAALVAVPAKHHR